MVMHAAGRKVAGIDLAPNPCPKCGKPMFKIPCKCPFRRKGWALCAKCLNPACGYQMGLVMQQRGARRKMGGLDSLSQRNFVPAQPQAEVQVPEGDKAGQPELGKNLDPDQKPIL